MRERRIVMPLRTTAHAFQIRAEGFVSVIRSSTNVRSEPRSTFATADLQLRPSEAILAADTDRVRRSIRFETDRRFLAPSPVHRDRYGHLREPDQPQS